jgi:hypothetical protein
MFAIVLAHYSSLGGCRRGVFFKTASYVLSG